MEELLDIATIAKLVILLTKEGVSFTEDFKGWKSKRISYKDRKAAWELYVEMETRIITQPLPPKHGDEQTALDSVYSLFQTTRDILHAQGPGCVVFAKIAIEILNQKVRCFTAKWHRNSLEGAFNDPVKCEEFRNDLEKLQEVLRAYTRTLAVLAGVEDTDSLSDTEQE